MISSGFLKPTIKDNTNLSGLKKIVTENFDKVLKNQKIMKKDLAELKKILSKTLDVVLGALDQYNLDTKNLSYCKNF